MTNNNQHGTSMIRANIELITPADAGRMLLGQQNVRPERPRLIGTYAEYMKAGLWKETGEAIKIDVNGRVIDGFHRLHACITAGVPFRVMVVRGLAPDAVDVLDSGANRSIADVIFGEQKNANAVASAATLLISWRRGALRHTSHSGADVKGARMPRHEILGFIRSNSSKWEVPIANGWRMRRGLGKIGPLGAFVAFSFEVAEHPQSEDFIAAISDGIGLSSGDARLAFRTWYINAMMGSAKRIPAGLAIYALCRAWNRWLSGTKVKIIQTSTFRKEELELLGVHDGAKSTLRAA